MNLGSSWLLARNILFNLKHQKKSCSWFFSTMSRNSMWFHKNPISWKLFKLNKCARFVMQFDFLRPEKDFDLSDFHRIVLITFRSVKKKWIESKADFNLSCSGLISFFSQSFLFYRLLAVAFTFPASPPGCCSGNTFFGSALSSSHFRIWKTTVYLIKTRGPRTAEAISSASRTTWIKSRTRPTSWSG